MAIIKLDQIKSGNSVLDRLQNNIQNCFNQLNANPFNSAKIMSGIAFTAGTSTVINTGFNGQLQGWILVGKNAPCDPYEIARTANTLTLQSETSAVVDLLLF